MDSNTSKSAAEIGSSELQGSCRQAFVLDTSSASGSRVGSRDTDTRAHPRAQNPGGAHGWVRPKPPSPSPAPSFETRCGKTAPPGLPGRTCHIPPCTLPPGTPTSPWAARPPLSATKFRRLLQQSNGAGGPTVPTRGGGSHAQAPGEKRHGVGRCPYLGTPSCCLPFG